MPRNFGDTTLARRAHPNRLRRPTHGRAIATRRVASLVGCGRAKGREEILRNPTAVIFTLLGLLLLAFAIALSPASLERAFVGTYTGVLAWGPNLFRALLAFHGVGLLVAAMFVGNSRSNRRTSSLAVESPPSRLGWTVLGVLCGVSLALRLWHLNTDLWLDELLTLTDFLRLPFREIVVTFPSQNQHPLYSLLGRVAIVALGESPASARLPAVLFGVASIWALFLLGRRVSNTREALLACALMTFSYHHIWFSQNARGYTGLLFFSTVATWLWIDAMERGAARRWAAYATAVWFGLWTHSTMIFVVAAHGLAYLSLFLARTESSRLVLAGKLDPGFRWKPIVCWLFAATLAVQVQALALPEFIRSAIHEVSLDSEWISPVWVLNETVRRLADGGVASIALVGALAALVAGFGSLAARNWRIASLLVMPAVLGGATMVALGHNLWPRFFFFCMGFILLVAVRGFMVLTEWPLARLKWLVPERFVLQVGTAACLAGVGLSALTIPRSYLPKQDFTGARRYVAEVSQPGDGIVAVGLAGLAYHRYYAPEWSFVEHAADLAALQRRDRQVWLVYTLPVHLAAWFPEIWNVVQREYEVVRVFPGTLGGGDLAVCRWRGGRQAGTHQPRGSRDDG